MKKEIKVHCENCGKELDYNKIVWLELNNKTGLWCEENTVKELESQGLFPFGKDCAKKVLGTTL